MKAVSPGSADSRNKACSFDHATASWNSHEGGDCACCASGTGCDSKRRKRRQQQRKGELLSIKPALQSYSWIWILTCQWQVEAEQLGAKNWANEACHSIVWLHGFCLLGEELDLLLCSWGGTTQKVPQYFHGSPPSVQYKVNGLEWTSF